MQDTLAWIAFVFALFGLQAWANLFRVEKRLRQLEEALGRKSSS